VLNNPDSSKVLHDSTTQRPVWELLSLAAPTIAQMASYTVMQFTDTWMLSRVGDVHAASAGMSGILAFALISLGFGVILVVNTLVSQAYGREDFPACGRYMWQGVWFGVVSGLAILPLLPLMARIFGAIGHDETLARLESAYFQITLSFAAAKLVATSMGQFLLAVNRPGMVLIAAVAGSLTDFFWNWVLIFGNLGFPRLGVVGGAWASNIGQTVELLVLAWFVFRPAIARRYHVYDWRLRPKVMRTLLAVGVPSGFQVTAEVLAWALFTVWVLGQFGTSAMAATNLAFNYMRVSFMPAFGLSAAVTALVGRYIGRRRPDIAVRRAHLGFVIAALYMLACGLLFYFGRWWLIDQFTNSPEVLRIGAMLMIFAAVYQFFDAVYIIYSGALRGAGDTFVPAVVVGSMCWGIVLGGGYLMARYFPQLGVAGPWYAATAYGVILGAFLMLRFVRGRWREIRLEEPQVSPADEAMASGPIHIRATLVPTPGVPGEGEMP
jgi:MATE family multidrug resistance protein